MTEPLEDPEGVLDLRVERISRESDGVVSLVLADPAGDALPAWTPGAHLDLELPGLVRQYSLCSDPADRYAYRIAVLREEHSRGGSRYLHDTLRVGDPVVVGGPRNHFPLVPAERYLFLAGGIGITPILPMAAAAEAAGADFTLAYGGRSRASMAFLGELAAHGDRLRVRAEDEQGALPLDELLAGAGEGTAVYCCGPEGLLTAVEQRCEGRTAGSLHLERFRARTPAPGEALPDREFAVRCEKSGLCLQVPAGRSLVDCLDEAGVAVPTACREGICGSCETGVLAGEVDHRDSLLAPEDRRTHRRMMPCVSRAASAELVLDL